MSGSLRRFKKSKKHINSCQYIRVKAWKDECLYLDWNEDTKNAKLLNLVEVILKYDNSGPDIIALQEVENLNNKDHMLDKIDKFTKKLKAGTLL